MFLSHSIFAIAAEAASQATKPGFVATLGLNWKLFLAQLVNFGVVLFVLWKWVMKPVAGALEARREKIEKSVRQAAEIEARMKEFEIQRLELMKKTRSESEQIMILAREAAQQTAQEVLQKARLESEKIMMETKAVIESEKNLMLAEVRDEVADLTVAATEKILRHKLDGQKDRAFVEETLNSMK